MKTTSCLTAASSILLATIALTPVQAQDELVGRTCRAALEGHSFRLSDPPQDTDCCYVQPEVPWYLEQDPVVAENRYYLRGDGQNVYTLSCDIDYGATGSIGSVAGGNNGGIGVTPRLEDGGTGDNEDNVDNGDDDNVDDGDDDNVDNGDDDNVDNGDDSDTGDDGGPGNPGNKKPKGHAGESPGPGEDEFGDGIKGKSQ